jgi:hypothetical protein
MASIYGDPERVLIILALACVRPLWWVVARQRKKHIISWPDILEVHFLLYLLHSGYIVKSHIGWIENKQYIYAAG